MESRGEGYGGEASRMEQASSTVTQENKTWHELYKDS